MIDIEGIHEMISGIFWSKWVFQEHFLLHKLVNQSYKTRTIRCMYKRANGIFLAVHCHECLCDEIFIRCTLKG